MFLARHCKWCSVVLRGIASVPKNHYESLGVKKSATQGEIKTAYYELSKRFHPDTNQGSEESLTRFRQVTDAYEILGNVKSRKLYDRGLVVGESGSTLRPDVEDEDDPQARFYQRREKREKVPTTVDRTTVYNFDAWAKAHYDKSRERKAASRFHMEKRVQNLMHRKSQKDNFLLISLAVFIAGTLSIVALGSADNDQVLPKAAIKAKDR